MGRAVERRLCSNLPRSLGRKNPRAVFEEDHRRHVDRGKRDASSAVNLSVPALGWERARRANHGRACAGEGRREDQRFFGRGRAGGGHFRETCNVLFAPRSDVHRRPFADVRFSWAGWNGPGQLRRGRCCIAARACWCWIGLIVGGLAKGAGQGRGCETWCCQWLRDGEILTVFLSCRGTTDWSVILAVIAVARPGPAYFGTPALNPIRAFPANESRAWARAAACLPQSGLAQNPPQSQLPAINATSGPPPPRFPTATTTIISNLKTSRLLASPLPTVFSSHHPLRSDNHAARPPSPDPVTRTCVCMHRPPARRRGSPLHVASTRDSGPSERREGERVRWRNTTDRRAPAVSGTPSHRALSLGRDLIRIPRRPPDGPRPSSPAARASRNFRTLRAGANAIPEAAHRATSSASRAARLADGPGLERPPRPPCAPR